MLAVPRTWAEVNVASQAPFAQRRQAYAQLTRPERLSWRQAGVRAAKRAAPFFWGVCFVCYVGVFQGPRLGENFGWTVVLGHSTRPPHPQLEKDQDRLPLHLHGTLRPCAGQV